MQTILRALVGGNRAELSGVGEIVILYHKREGHSSNHSTTFHIIDTGEYGEAKSDSECYLNDWPCNAHIRKKLEVNILLNTLDDEE